VPRPGMHAKEALHVIERLAEEAQRLVVLHVSDVLAENGVMPGGEAEGVLEFAACGNYVDTVLPRSMVPARTRAIAATPSSGRRRRGDGIVYCGPDRPVVGQESVRQTLQPPKSCSRLTIGSSLKFHSSSPGRGTLRPQTARDGAVCRAASRRGSDSGSDKSKIAFGPLSEQHDRPLRAEQQLALLWRDLT